MNKLDNIVSFIPVIKGAIPADLSIAVCDREKFIAYWPGVDIDLGIHINQALHPEEPLSVAIRENTTLKAEVPAQYYGFEFTGTATPLHDLQGQVIGGIAVQLRRQSELKDISDHIAQALTQANHQLSFIAQGSKTLLGSTRQLLDLSQETVDQLRSTDQVISLIKNIGDETKLLGINAAIEAAHAGEKGRGFGIVANQIRKLSNETIVSTKSVQDTLRSFREAASHIEDAVERIAVIVQEQSTSSQQIAAFIQEVQAMAEKLNDFAKKL